MYSQNTYESHVDLAVSAALVRCSRFIKILLIEIFQSNLRSMTTEELTLLLDDDSRLDSIIMNLPQVFFAIIKNSLGSKYSIQVRSMPTDKESALAANKSLAEWNLAQKPRIEATKTQTMNLYDQMKLLQNEVNILKTQLGTNFVEKNSVDKNISQIPFLLQNRWTQLPA